MGCKSMVFEAKYSLENGSTSCVTIDGVADAVYHGVLQLFSPLEGIAFLVLHSWDVTRVAISILTSRTTRLRQVYATLGHKFNPYLSMMMISAVLQTHEPSQMRMPCRHALQHEPLLMQSPIFRTISNNSPLSSTSKFTTRTLLFDTRTVSRKDSH